MLYKRGGRDRSSYVGRRQSEGRKMAKVRGGESNETPLKSIKKTHYSIFGLNNLIFAKIFS
jgi:hypothetical protein